MRKERLLGIISFIIVTAIALSVTLVMASGLRAQPPAVTITSPQEGATVSGTIMVQGNASDPDGNGTLHRVEIRIDNGTWRYADGNTSWTYTWDTTTVQDGEHSIAARSYDGTSYSPVVSRNVTVDNVNVELAVTCNGTLGEQHWYVSNVSVTITPVANTSSYNHTMYSIDGGPWQVYNESFNLTADGVHILTYYAVTADDVQGEPHTCPVKIDTTRPSITCHLIPATPGGDNGWYTGPVEVTLDAVDNQSGINRTEYRDVTGNIWTDYAGLFQISAQGNHTFMFRATDAAGHTTTGSRQIRIDHTPPAVEVLAPATEYVKGTVTVSWNASDQVDGNLSRDISIHLVREDNTSLTLETNLSDTGTYTWNTRPVTAGVYRLRVNATDDAGNTGANVSGWFTLDNLPPAIVIDQPSQGQVLGGEGRLDVVWNATDNIDNTLDTIWISYREADGETWHNVNMSFPLDNTGETSIDISTWDNGKYRLRLNATDDAGNTGWAISSNFTIDTTDPDVSLVRPRADYLYINLLDREIIPPIPIAFVPQPFTDITTIVIGRMTVEVDATDAFSDIDRVEFYSDDMGSGSNNEDNWRWRYKDTTTPYAWTWNERSFGQYRVRVIAYDAAGNTDEARMTNILYINV
jgi:hypothetical protein